MHKTLLIIFLFSLSLAADDLQKSFEKADRARDLNHRLLRAIATHESGLNSCVVGFVLKDQNIVAAADVDLKSSPVKYKKSPYKKWAHYSLSFKSVHEAKLAIPWLEKVTAASTGFDIGLMQINSRNAHHNRWDIGRLIEDPEYNIDKGAQILSECRQRFHSDPPKTLECYNKGTKTANFDYQYYSSVFSKYMGKPVQAPNTIRVVMNQDTKKKKIAQADKEFILPREYGVGRTLF